MRCWSCTALLLCAAAPNLGAKMTAQRKVEPTSWEQAERGLETLQAIPEESRTRADYARTMDGFRAVYHAAPGDVHAPDSVSAVAELLAEQGLRWHDPKSLKDAVGQYEFLRVQYPASSLRIGALLAQAQIYENDLHDTESAKERYQLLLKQYPRSSLAEEARAGIASLERGKANRRSAASGTQDSAKNERTTEQIASASTKATSLTSFAAMPTTGEAREAKATPDANVVAAPERSGISDPVDGELDSVRKQASADQNEVAAVAVPLHVAKISIAPSRRDGAGEGNSALVNTQLHPRGDRPWR